MPRAIVMTYLDEGVSVRAELLEDRAPITCHAIWEVLPVLGDGVGAMFSGTVAGLFIDPTIVIPVENATSCIQTGDVMFTHYGRGVRHGYPEPISEIYWAYDRYVNLTIPGQVVPASANIFGRIVGDPAPFYAVCRRIAREGWTRLEIRREE